MKIKLVGPAGAYTNFAEMLDSGVILFEGGRISHVTHEMIKGQTIYVHNEEIKPSLMESKLEQEVIKKKPGRKPKNESRN